MVKLNNVRSVSRDVELYTNSDQMLEAYRKLKRTLSRPPSIILLIICVVKVTQSV
jgi:hypothetical protein